MDDQGRTALHRVAASFNDTTEAVEYLIDCGIDLFTCDHRGETAYHASARYNPTATEVILDSGFPIDQPTQPTSQHCGGATTLQIACGANEDPGIAPVEDDTVSLLLKRGANVNHRDNAGRTALHILANIKPTMFKHGSKPTCSLLLQNMRESAIVAKDDSGKTAGEIAAQTHRSHQELIAKFPDGWRPSGNEVFVRDIVEERILLITQEWPAEREIVCRSMQGKVKTGGRVESLVRQRDEYRAFLSGGGNGVVADEKR